VCGIAGFSGEFDPDRLERMNDIQSHRGPDDEGVFYDPDAEIGLAHRRLSILDLSDRGRQPMWDETQSACIVLNGEIFNYRELRHELERDGFHFRSATDTEVLLNLYLRDGETMVERLNGQFAFAIWDPKRRQTFLARDGFGIKPLYYATTPAGFLFASELKALLCEESVDRSLNLEAVQYHLTYLWCPAPPTMLRSVKKLEPGHAMMVRSGKIDREWSFYSLPFDEPIEPMRIEDAAARVRSAVHAAVKRQMVADVPVGAFLSGGLDSSAVVAFAREYSRKKMQCFTIAFRGDSLRDEGLADDLPYARRVAEHLDVDLHTIDVGPEMAYEFETMIYHLDEPLADPAALNVMFISRLARQHGIKVLLSGAGGDDVFSGYRRHRALALERYWRWLPKTLRHALAIGSKKLLNKGSRSRRLSKALRYCDLESDERIASYFFWTDPGTVRSLRGPMFQDAEIQSAVPLLRTLQRLSPGVPDLNRMLALEQTFFLADHNLNYTDKMCMAAGLEARIPLLDPDVVALAARLPLNHKQRGGQGKWIFRKAMQPYLPQSILNRPKTGFGVPLRHWMQRELRPVVNDVLSPASLRDRGLFSYESVQQLIRDDRNGRIDGSYTILSLVSIELWCRQFLSTSRFGVKEKSSQASAAAKN
jgi:asparagine synthase (glutamine-hydrolysing)